MKTLSTPLVIREIKSLAPLAKIQKLSESSLSILDKEKSLTPLVKDNILSVEFKNDRQPLSPLDKDVKLDNESLEIREARMFFFTHTELIKLPSDARSLILSKVADSQNQKMIFIQNFLQDIATYQVIHPGMTVTWETYYGNKKRQCSKTDPLCQESPLSRSDCKCHLTYSIGRAGINMSLFEDINLKYNGKPLIITPQTLLDYGFLYQIVFTNPDQASSFGRKLSDAVSQSFKMGKKFVTAFITSKAPEWTFKNETLFQYPAQHEILLHSSFRNKYTTLYWDEFPWPCSITFQRQIRHWRCRVIACVFHPDNDSDLSDDRHNLISESATQRIISPSFLEFTPLHAPSTFTHLVDFYKQKISEKKDSRSPFKYGSSGDEPEEDFYDYDNALEDDLDDIGIHNLENALEG